MCRNFSLSGVRWVQTNYWHMKNCMLGSMFGVYNDLNHKLETFTRFIRTDDREDDRYIVEHWAHKKSYTNQTSYMPL